MKIDKAKLQVRNNEIWDRLDEIENLAKRENRSFTDEEKQEYDSLVRESAKNTEILKSAAVGAELSKIREAADKSANLREYLQGVRQKREDNVLTLAAKSPADGSSITESGAVNLYIHDVLDTQLEGLGLPQGVTLLTGVTSDEVWPVNVNDAEMEEVGEITPVNEQAINFDNVKAVSRRVSLAIGVSNKAIDYVAFDLFGFIQFKIRKAFAIYLAKKVYSHAAWNGNKGPFSLVTAKTLDLSTDPFKKILMAVADIARLGFEGTPVFTIDKVTEAELKATLKTAGVPGYIIENGLLAGYPYTTSGHINKTLNGNKYEDDGRYIGIGFWDWMSIQQHGDVRLTIDATSAQVAKSNKTVVVFSTEISMTELSSKINGNDSGLPQAFELYKISNESLSDI